MKHAIGTKVKIVDRGDNTVNPKYVGKIGVVISHNANELTGNTEDDPLHRLQIDGLIGTESFWYEELEATP